MTATLYERLCALPTLNVGWTDDLKVSLPEVRVWVARTTLADGEPWEHRVSVETYHDGRWIEHGFDGDTVRDSALTTYGVVLP